MLPSVRQTCLYTLVRCGPVFRVAFIAQEVNEATW